MCYLLTKWEEGVYNLYPEGPNYIFSPSWFILIKEIYANKDNMKHSKGLKIEKSIISQFWHILQFKSYFCLKKFHFHNK